MGDLADLAELYRRNAVAWDTNSHPVVSGEVCARHAADWQALHVLVLAAGAWVENLTGAIADEAVLRAEEEAVAAARRLASHLAAPYRPPASAAGRPAGEVPQWPG